MSASDMRAALRSPEPRLALAATAAVLLVVMSFTLPVLTLEGWRDWWTYEAAGEALLDSRPIYAAENGDLLFLYPPAMAVLWASGISDTTWLVMKLGALAILATGGAAGLTAAIAGLLSAPVQHDLILGNVMVFYLVAVSLLAFRGGWPGAAALGAIIAVSMKPTLIPILAWMLVVRRRDLGRTMVVAIGITLFAAALAGPHRYLEYLVALPTFGAVATTWPGNLGVSAAVGAQASFIVSLASLAVTLAAAARWGERSLPIAIAMSLLFQPSLGIIYTGMLVPAVILMWQIDRRACLVAGLTVPILAIVNPVVASTVVAGLCVLALAVSDRRPIRQPIA